MKLKYQFVVQKVGGQAVAVAVGRDSQGFNGMIKLNESGERIFQLLNGGNLTQEQLLEQFAQYFGTSVESVRQNVLEFLDLLRQNDLLSE